MDDENKKSWGASAWDTLKSGFKPMGARADERVESMRKETGDQYAKDRAQGANYMKQKFVKGFQK